MEHKNFISLDERYVELESMIEEQYPGFLENLSHGARVLVVQEDAVASGLSDGDLFLLGAVVKVAAHRGNAVLLARTSGVSLLTRKRSGDFSKESS